MYTHRHIFWLYRHEDILFVFVLRYAHSNPFLILVNLYEVSPIHFVTMMDHHWGGSWGGVSIYIYIKNGKGKGMKGGGILRDMFWLSSPLFKKKTSSHLEVAFFLDELLGRGIRYVSLSSQSSLSKFHIFLVSFSQNLAICLLVSDDLKAPKRKPTKAEVVAFVILVVHANSFWEDMGTLWLPSLKVT